VGHGAAAVDEHADLAAGLARELAELACELVGDETLRRKAALSQAFELAGLAGLQAVCVAGDVDLGPLSRVMGERWANLAAIGSEK
jgi:hypothetical protein